MLETRDLFFSYDSVNPILDHVDLRVKKGEIVIVTGPTGSGKSTLALCLCGFIPRIIEGKFSGSLLIDGKDATNLSISEIAHDIALVQQDPESQICTLNVSDEVAFGPENYLMSPKQIAEITKTSLKAVDISYLADKPTFALSGGEKQRIAIASMLACQPNYLILDEPSSSLDPGGIIRLRQILLELKQKNLGIVCIEHNLHSMLPIADCVLSVSEGKVLDWSPDLDKKQEKLAKVTAVANAQEALLSAENLYFSYNDKHVIKKATIEIHKSEIIALMGDNGSGKTTFLNLLAGLLKPDIGSIHLGGNLLNKAKRKDIAKKAGVVFQNPNHQIFEKTVWKEQILGLELLGLIDDQTLQQSKDFLYSAHLAGFENRNPFSLSYGQKRRLNVSSVTNHNPAILFLDEPFIGQDKEGRDFITRIILKGAKTGGSSVIITHDPSFACHYCTRIVFLDKGSIILDGPPSSVLNRLEKIGKSEYAAIEVSV